MVKLNFNKNKCLVCKTHACLTKCQYLDMDAEEAGAEMEKIEIEPENQPEGEKRKARPIAQDHLSRKDRLERRIIGMLLQDEKYHCLVDKKDLKLFSQWARDIIDCLFEQKLDEKRSASRDLENLLNVLALEVEADQVNIDDEMAICLIELRRMIIQEEMRKLTEQIAQAERDQKPKKAQLLMKELHQLSQDLFNNNVSPQKETKKEGA